VSLATPDDAALRADVRRVAALLGEIGVPVRVMRGIAVVSRAAGLVGHGATGNAG